MQVLALKSPCLKKLHLIKYVALAILSFQCHALEEHVPPPKSSPSPDLVMRGWETVVVRQGQNRVKVRADSLMRSHAQGNAHFFGRVNVVFFDGQGDTASVLSASRGMVDAESRHITVAGQVVVLARDSTRLETDSLRWDREKERILGEGLVSIFRPEGREQGIGFDASADLKQWTLKQVQTQVNR